MRVALLAQGFFLGVEFTLRGAVASCIPSSSGALACQPQQSGNGVPGSPPHHHYYNKLQDCSHKAWGFRNAACNYLASKCSWSWVMRLVHQTS